MRPRRSDIPLVAALAWAALTPGLATAQAPAAEPAQQPAAPAPAPAPVGSLTARYRIQERFTARDDKGGGGTIGQNQVAFRETSSSEDDGEKGTRVIQAIYSERPAVVSPVDERVVTDSVRHYTSVTITPDPWKGRTDRRPLNDLTIWYRTVAGDVPAVLVLTPGRALREEEYKFAINYDFVTNLSFLLPDLPVRIGETWNVVRSGAIALVNDEVRNGTLTGKLAEVRAHPTAPGLQVAVIDVTGRIATGFERDLRDTTIRARIQFAFAPPARPDEATIDAPGFIEKLTLAQVSNLTIPGQTQKKGFKRELVLERKKPGSDPPLAIPDPAPEATPENSWLTYTDLQGRYNLRHPQGFQPSFPPGGTNVVDLKRFHADVRDDIIRLEFVTKPETKPEASFKKLVEEWRSKGIEVLPGLSERLPAADWPDLAVYHMEAALTSEDPAVGRPVRRYFDAYVLQFPRNVSVFASATTFLDQPAGFRKQVETMLKTIKLGTPK